jgi:hypothetical protein
MIVRKAHSLDSEWILEQLKIFSSIYETKHELFPKDTKEASLKVLQLIEQQIVLIAETDSGEKAGFIAGVLSPHYFNQDLMTLCELFWWVEEKHRGSRAGLMLYNEFVKIGKDLADWIVVCLKFGSPVKEEFFLKRDFKKLDQSFLLEVI